MFYITYFRSYIIYNIGILYIIIYITYIRIGSQLILLIRLDNRLDTGRME